MLELALKLEQSSISQLESIRVIVTLTNAGPLAWVPSAYDTSGALAFFVRDSATIVRRASGLTHQEMMIRGRVNAEPSIEELDAGAQWSVSLDLGQWMYAPPPGRYKVTAELLVPELGNIVSNEVELEVTPEAVVSARAVRDNPILDGLALLLERQHPAQPLLLRQYNHAKPLAAWYGEALPMSRMAALARPTYFKTDSFEHFFERWLVWVEEDTLIAQAFVNGRPTAGRLEAPFLRDLQWLPSVCDQGAGRLELFAVEGTELVAFAFEPGALRARFRVPLPDASQSAPEVIGDADGYFVAVARSGVSIARLDRDGHATPWQQRFNSDLLCASLSIDSVDRRVLAAFWDGAVGRDLQLVEVDLATERFALSYQERQDALSALLEFAFDRDMRGVFHMLAHTHDGLLYKRQDQAGVWIAPPGVRRAPLVSARPALHLGFFDPQRGYNFYLFRNGVLYRDPTADIGGPK